MQDRGLFQRLNIERKEVYFHKANLQEFLKKCQEAKIPESERGIPMLFYHGRCAVGDKPIMEFIDKIIAKEISGKKETEQITVPQQGTIFHKLKPISLLAVVGGAAADSINPCAFAVLILLITTVLSSGSKRRALLAGLAFSLSIFISYFLMGIGIYRALATAKSSIIFSRVVAGFAVLIGLANLKDVFWYGKGFVMEVPFSWRPKMKALIKSVTSPTGAFLIGFLVSLFLLPCTSGPYLAILGMLSQRAVSRVQPIFYLLLYNAIFIIPMLAITFGAYFGLDTAKAEKIRQKNIRLIHFIVGVIMIGIGLWLFLS